MQRLLIKITSCLVVSGGIVLYNIQFCLFLQLTDLLDGKYSDVIGEYHIIDSRYPYEFEGGHIKVLNYFQVLWFG